MFLCIVAVTIMFVGLYHMDKSYIMYMYISQKICILHVDEFILVNLIDRHIDLLTV